MESMPYGFRPNRDGHITLLCKQWIVGSCYRFTIVFYSNPALHLHVNHECLPSGQYEWLVKWYNTFFRHIHLKLEPHFVWEQISYLARYSIWAKLILVNWWALLMSSNSLVVIDEIITKVLTRHLPVLYSYEVCDLIRDPKPKCILITLINAII